MSEGFFRRAISKGSSPGLEFLLCALAVAVAIVGWHTLRSGTLSLGVVGFAVLLLACVSLWGHLAVALAAPRHAVALQFPFVFAVGSVVTSALLLAAKFMLPVPGWVALVGLLGVGALLRRWLVGASAAREEADAPPWVSLLVTLVGLLAATLWSHQHLFPFGDVGGGIVYRPWADAFVQAGLVSFFAGHTLPQALGHLELAGTPMVFYHYGGFVLAGAYADFTSSPTLLAFDAFLIPFGVFLVALSSYSLGAFWWGPRAGLASLAVAMLLPDASFYGFRNAYFSYYRALENSGSLLWGVAVGGIALSLAAAAWEQGRRRLLLATVALACLCFLFKAHVFVFLLPLVVLGSLVSFRGLSTKARLVWISVAIVTGGLLALVSQQLPNAPRFALDGSAGADFFAFVGQSNAEGTAREFWSRVAGGDVPGGVAARTGLILLAGLGVLPLLYVALVARRWRRSELCGRDWIPLFAIAGVLLLAVGLAPNTRGAPFELQHRPFFFAYWLLAVWCGGALHAAWGHVLPRTLQVVLLIALLGVPAALADDVLGDRIHFASQHLRTPLPAGYTSCLAYVRRSSSETDVVQDSQNDPNAITLGLSERRAYLARPRHHWREPTRKGIVRRRLGQMEALRQASSIEQIERIAGRLPIRFYLLHPGTEVAWPAAFLADPTRRCGGYRVYEFGGQRRAGDGD